MGKSFKLMLNLALCVGILFCLSSCSKQKTYEEGYNDGYEDGYIDASNELSDYGFDMYQEGYDEAYGDFVYGIIEDEAVHYAVEHGGWHPEEAMCIIDAYENGEMAFGSMSVSEEDYKEAVKSLYFYYEYFYGGSYKNK